MKGITLLMGVFFSMLSTGGYAAKCSPVTKSSSISGALAVSQVSLGVSATAMGGASLETCGLIISSTEAKTKSADVELSNMNVVGANAISIVNMTQGAMALGKGTVEGHGFTVKSEALGPRIMMNTVASIVGNGSMLIAGGELSETDPPQGVDAVNIRDISGKVSYNRVDAKNTDLINTSFSKAGVTATQLMAFGGTSTANTDSFKADNNKNSNLIAFASAQAGDTATALIATGIKLGDGDAALGDTGTAKANSLSAKNVQMRTVAVARAGNQAMMLSGMSGSAVANSIDISDSQNINAMVVSMAGNNALLSSAIGIPLRPKMLPETTVTSNSLTINKGSVNGSSYVFNANSSSVNQALLGGRVNVNTVNLKESDHVGVTTNLNANTGTLATAVGFFVDGSSIKGSSITANSVSHDKRSRVIGTTLTLQGNQSHVTTAVMGGSVIDNSVNNGENANMQGEAVVLMTNNSLVSTAMLNGKTIANSLENGGDIQGGVVQIAQNNSMLTTAIGQGASSTVNSVINSSKEGKARTLGVVGVLGNNAMNSMALMGGTTLVNSINNKKNVMGMTSVVGNNSLGAVSVGSQSDLTVNSVSNSGQMTGLSVVANNQNLGSMVFSGAGNVNSIVNGSDGTLMGIYSTLGNSGMVLGGGSVNSIANKKGTMQGVGMIQGSNGIALMDGTATSINNGNGSMMGVFSILGSTGIAIGQDSAASSIINSGNMTGFASIVGSTGVSLMGGTSTSIINKGSITGGAAIVGSTGVAIGQNAVASSIVNGEGGTISGAAFVVGTNAVAWAGRVHGSVQVNSGSAAGVGVVGNMPVGGVPQLFPNPMISQSIVVNGGATRAYLF